MNKVALIGFILGFFLIINIAQAKYEIKGNTVFINETEYYISAFPHTIYSPGYIYFDIILKKYDGDVDILLGFNDTTIQPKVTMIYQPKIIQNSYTCEHNFEYDIKTKTAICYVNETEYDEKSKLYATTNNKVIIFKHEYDSIDEKTKTIYWNKTINYTIAGKIDFEKFNYEMNNWYYVPKITVKNNQKYSFKAYVDVPPLKSGKYWICIKPSSYSIKGAISNNQFYCLDPWYNSSWQYRIKITINHNKVYGNLTNFPLLINLTYSGLTNAQDDGDDILFTDENNTKLSHEIEYFNNTTGELVAWVRVNLTNITDTIIYLYYGNPNAENQQNVTDVWDSNYVLVQHLNESTGTRYDSSKYGNDGTPSNTNITGGAGWIDGANVFHGDKTTSIEYIDCGSDSSLNITDEITIEAWVKAIEFGEYEGIITKTKDGDTPYGYSLVRPGTNKFAFRVGDGSTYEYIESDNTYTDTNWHHVVGVRRNGTDYLYVDGQLQTDTSTRSINTTTYPVVIGRYYSGHNNFYFNGTIDEVRISNVGRSDAWIRTEYNNLYDPSSFYTISEQETKPTEEPIIEGGGGGAIAKLGFLTLPDKLSISVDEDTEQEFTFNISSIKKVKITAISHLEEIKFDNNKNWKSLELEKGENEIKLIIYSTVPGIKKGDIELRLGFDSRKIPVELTTNEKKLIFNIYEVVLLLIIIGLLMCARIRG